MVGHLVGSLCSAAMKKYGIVEKPMLAWHGIPRCAWMLPWTAAEDGCQIHICRPATHTSVQLGENVGVCRADAEALSKIASKQANEWGEFFRFRTRTCQVHDMQNELQTSWNHGEVVRSRYSLLMSLATDR